MNRTNEGPRNTNLTELVFLLDRSGSMHGLEQDTIGGFNGMLEQQKREPGEAVVTTVLFDDQYQLLHDRIPLQAVQPMDGKTYYVRGCTALLDAMGKAITKIRQAHEGMHPDCRPNRVLFVITTDGLENASRSYSWAQIRELVEGQKAQGWEFLFLGANLDAVATAARWGIHRDRAVQFHSDHKGTQLNYQTVSQAVSDFRQGRMAPAGAPEGASWKQAVEKDFASRQPDRS